MPGLLQKCKCARLAAGVFIVLTILSGCASLVPQTMGLRTAWPESVEVQTEARDVPFFPQQEYQCGPAALATTLVYAGAKVTPDDLVNLVYLPERHGSLQIEMLAAARRFSKVSYQLAPRFGDLLREVAAGNPVIVLQDTGVGPIRRWHYAVVIGFDYPAGELYFRSGVTKRLAIPFTIFEYTWKKSNYWAMVTMPPGHIPATAGEAAYLTAISAMERVGDADAATTAYAAFLERWPDNVSASIGLANRHYVHHELKDTVRVLRQALLRHPDSVAILNNLAQSLSDQGSNEEALRLIEQAEKTTDDFFAAAVRETHDLILQRMVSNH